MGEAAHTSAFKLELPNYALHAISALEAAGFEAWCVGGCVRDAILGRAVNDYDIATSASWNDAEKAMVQAGYSVRRSGIKHGTITAYLQDCAIEITTYRVDGAYSDGRHPDSVEFSSRIEEDLARRDFTINAMAYHPERGLLDCHGGADDLRAGIIRVVGDGRARFSEDALRILRACRFASQLGFRIEAETMQAMWSNKMRLYNISAERITYELQEMLLGPHVHDALMSCVDVIAAIMPELAACKDFEQHTPYHIYDVLEHTAWVVERSPATPLARWAALFHDLGKPGAFFMDGTRGHFYGHPRLSEILARDIMKRLSLSPTFVEKVALLVRMHDRTIPADKRHVKKALQLLGDDAELFRTLCRIKRADALAQSELSEPRIQLAADLEHMLDEILANDEAFSVAQLAINGHDVMSLGIPAGPAVGAALKDTLDAVVDERVANERRALLDYLESRKGDLGKC